jgi:uncharacterized protein (UPF0332 family)
MDKALQAAASAKLLLDAGDADGACNRAYYAMFDAARAALIASGASADTEIGRTHGGLISAFSLRLVKTGRVAMELGKALNKAEELRLVADYKGDAIGREDAAWAVQQAQVFVTTMQATFMMNTPNGDLAAGGAEPS